MTAQINMNEQQNETQILKTRFVSSRIAAISQALISLDKNSISTSNKVQDLQVYVRNLKADIQRVMGRIDQNVELFRIMLSDKLKLIMTMLSDKQLHIEMTLEECYKVISELVEIFLSIGYELEDDITNLSLKVESLDSEIKEMSELTPFEADRNYNQSYWFINDEYRLTIRENESMGSILPKFKSGDTFERKQFITFMMQVFEHYKVPESAWVDLVTNQLVESALNWWFLHENKPPINWSKFTELFMDANFDDGMDRKINNSKSVTNISNNQLTEVGLKKKVSNSKTKINANRDDLLSSISFGDQITEENQHEAVHYYS